MVRAGKWLRWAVLAIGGLIGLLVVARLMDAAMIFAVWGAINLFTEETRLEGVQLRPWVWHWALFAAIASAAVLLEAHRRNTEKRED